MKQMAKILLPQVVSKYEVVGCSISVGKMKPKPMLSK